MLVPKLRFKRDDGTEYPEWEKSTLSTISKKVERKATADSTAPIMMISQGNGFIYQSDKYSRNNAGQSLARYTLLKKDEMAYNHGASKLKPYGVVYCLKEESEARVPFVYHTFGIMNGVSKFWNYSLNTSKMDRQLKKMVSSGARMDGLLNISYDTYIQTAIFIPDIEEQQKIADFLSTVDEVIAQSEKEVQNLEQQKKAAMQKIFSQEVRFKREDGREYPEWEETTIGEYCDILDNMRKPITKKDRVAGIYPYYGSTNIQDYVSGYIFDEPLVLLGEDAAPFMDFRNKPIAQLATGKYWVNNHAHCLRPQGNVVFFFYSIVHKDIREYINNPERAKLNQEDMVKIPISIPCGEEQQKIADFLSAYDETINYAKQELDKWKELKKGLLQQMFV